MSRKVELKTRPHQDEYQPIHEDPDLDGYEEPWFTSLLRCFGCFCGYLCLPSYGMCCYPYKTVDKGSRAVIQEFGQLKKNVGAGMHYVNPITEKLTSVSQKIQVIDLGRQNVMTADKLSINIDSVVYYQITDIEDSIFKVQDIVSSIKELSHAALRNVIGIATLEQCLGNKEKIADNIKQHVDENVYDWGVKINSIQIKDIQIPENIKTLLSSAVTAERDAQAKIIIAEGNVKAAELMRKASDILNTEAAMQVRALEVIDKLAHSNNAKIVILPSDLSLQNNLKNNLITRGIGL